MKKALLFFLLVVPPLAWSQDEDLAFVEEIKKEFKEDPKDERLEDKGWKKRNQVDPNDSDKSGRSIDLKSVLEEGFRKNPFEKIRQQQREQIELSKTDLWQKFWLPTVSLELDTSSHRIDRIRESSQSTQSMGAQQAPTGSLGLVIDEYTLFNWGRDYYGYQIEKDNLNRKTQQLSEAKRRLKFGLINQYFNLVRSKEMKN